MKEFLTQEAVVCAEQEHRVQFVSHLIKHQRITDLERTKGASKYRLWGRVVLIPIPVSENAADNAENADIGIANDAGLWTYQTPCYLLAAKQYPATSQ